MVIGIQGLDKTHEVWAEVRIDTPVPVLIGPGQRRMVHGLLDPQMVQLVTVRAQTDINFPKTVPSGKLSEEQLRELVPTVQAACPVVAVITVDTFLQLVTVDNNRL